MERMHELRLPDRRNEEQLALAQTCLSLSLLPGMCGAELSAVADGIATNFDRG